MSANCFRNRNVEKNKYSKFRIYAVSSTYLLQYDYTCYKHKIMANTVILLFYSIESSAPID